MADFGTDLRRERENKGVALEAIAETTKVSIRHLRALEEERFDQLPGGIFNKGILRSYVRFLELDEEHWTGRFTTAYGMANPTDEDAEWQKFSRTVGTKKSNRPDLRLRWAGVVLLFALLGVAGWLVWNYLHGRMANASEPATISAPLPVSASQAAPPPIPGRRVSHSALEIATQEPLPTIQGTVLSRAIGDDKLGRIA